MTGKVAVITGGSRGIGAGLVAGYRERGWKVVASARTIKPSQDPVTLDDETTREVARKLREIDAARDAAAVSGRDWMHAWRTTAEWSGARQCWRWER